jgi:hypothetical protein
LPVRAEVLLGCTRADILGHKQSQFLALDKRRARHGASVADAKDSNAFECDLICAGGATIPVEVHVTQLKLYERALVLRLCHEIAGHRPA